MPRVLRRVTSRGDTLLLLGCLLLSAGALILPERVTLSLGAGLRDTVLYPLLWLQEQAAEGRTSRARFQAIEAERDSIAYAAQSLAELRAENERLHAMLGLKPLPGFTTRPAEVLHQTVPTDARTLLLGIGGRDGVRAGDPVISPEGLIGLLQGVGDRTSTAMTWAHPDFRISAVTEDGAVLGIVAPSGTLDASESFLEFRGVAYRDTVATGTLVMSSGLGGVFPKGIPIGKVAGIRREELGWERVYRLAPLANPGHVAHVMVVRTGAAVRPAP